MKSKAPPDLCAAPATERLQTAACGISFLCSITSRMRNVRIIVAAFVLGLSTPLIAQTIADDFSTTGNLVGTTPDSGVGTWTQISSTATPALSVAGGFLTLSAGSGQNAQVNFSSSDLSSGTIYVGITFSVASGTISTTSGNISTFFGFRSGTAASGSYEVGVGLFRPNSTAQTAGALSTNTSQFQLGFGSGTSLTNGGTRWGSVSSVTTSYRAVIGWNLATDSAQLWIDPTSSSSTSITISSGLTGTTRGIYVRQGAATSGQINLSNLELSTDFNTAAGISAIPEPSTYATIVGALALIGVIYKRRHQPKVIASS